MIHYNFFNVYFPFFLFYSFFIIPADLTIVGFINESDGIGSLPLILAEEFKNKLSMNMYHMRSPISAHLSNLMLDELKDKRPGNILLFTGLLFELNEESKKLLTSDSIKIAISMFESTAIPQTWVSILNKNFDLICVPDNFLVEVYKKSGVIIPIFVLPIPLYLSSFYNKKSKKSPSVFVFGMTGDSFPHKNHILLTQAFIEEFGNNPDVQLIIHSKAQIKSPYLIELRDFFKTIDDYHNIIFLEKSLSSKEYIDFISFLNCYVLLSCSEGFSITPRQAMALEIPCILSDNTAHKTLCATGFAYPIVSGIEITPHYLRRLFAHKEFLGYQYTVDILDVRKALRNMYTQYAFYQEHAKKAKEWVMQYDFSNLKESYLSLLKPKKITLGSENTVSNFVLSTNSADLYIKYKKKLGI